MNVLSIFVPGQPQGQPRPRAFARGGRARVYDPGTAAGFKAAIMAAAKPQIPERPLEVPVWLSLALAFRRPKHHYTKKGLRPTAPAFHTSRPDADNCLKAVLDALTDIGLWRDDAQVASVAVTKLYAEKPGAQITVSILESLPDLMLLEDAP